MKKFGRFAAVLTAAAATVSAVTIGMSFGASADDAIGTAYLAGSFGTAVSWTADEDGITAASITGDGTYTVEWNLAEATSTGDSWFLIIVIEPAGTAENFTIHTFENLEVSLDSLSVDGNKISDLSGAVINTAYYEGAEGMTRIYLHDDWTKTGAAVLSDMDIESNITATFTVSGTATEDDDSSDDSSTEDSDSSSDDVISVITGDADRDGDITLNDAYLTLMYYAEHAVSNDSYVFDDDPDVNAAIVDAVDVDGDGSVTLNDAYVVLMYYANHAVQNDVTWEELLAE